MISIAVIIGVVVVLLFVLFFLFIRFVNTKKIKKNKDKSLDESKKLDAQKLGKNKQEKRGSKKEKTNQDNFNPANLSCQCPTFEYIVDGSEMRLQNPKIDTRFEEPEIKHAELSEVEDDGVSLQVRRNILKNSKVREDQGSKRKMDMESVGYSMESGDSKKNKEKDQSLSGVEVKSSTDEHYVIM